jgi:hypothetical protein
MLLFTDNLQSEPGSSSMLERGRFLITEKAAGTLKKTRKNKKELRKYKIFTTTRKLID